MAFNAQDVLGKTKKIRDLRKKRNPDEEITFAVVMTQGEKELFDRAIDICKRERIDALKKSIVPRLMIRWAQVIIDQYERGDEDDGK